MVSESVAEASMTRSSSSGRDEQRDGREHIGRFQEKSRDTHLLELLKESPQFKDTTFPEWQKFVFQILRLIGYPRILETIPYVRTVKGEYVEARKVKEEGEHDPKGMKQERTLFWKLESSRTVGQNIHNPNVDIIFPFSCQTSLEEGNIFE